VIIAQYLDALGENFEKSSKGFIDFLLLNEKCSLANTSLTMRPSRPVTSEPYLNIIEKKPAGAGFRYNVFM
jgi:hypothetical protein